MAHGREEESKSAPRRQAHGGLPPETVASNAKEGAGRPIARPVALLALIERMESWTVTDDLTSALLELAEAGMQIDSVYKDAVPHIPAEAAGEKQQSAAAPSQAVLMPIYRLSEGTIIHFGKDNKPISPPIHHVFISRLGNEGSFGCELQADSMVTDAQPRFKRGDILIFSTDRKVESGDFVFVKTRGADEFTQVFFGQGDQVRLRPLDPKHPERVARRFEIKMMCRLIGRYQDL